MPPEQCYKALVDTELGTMLAISDEQALCLLEFSDRPNLANKVEKLYPQVIEKKTMPIASIEAELRAYFDGKLREFKTPIRLLGSPFQKLVWSELLRIPYGQTRSYAEQATIIGKQSAYRAVANANAANRIAIMIPCHRVINSNGNLGGYAGGIARKRWLLDFELP